MSEPEFIVVRDRRQPRQFSIANVVIDQWLPIIGMPGYTIYSLYVRMAGIDDERCWPGYTMITTHLGIARATVSRYNKLLRWCRLIHIEEGDRHNTNNYYILDVPTVDVDTLHHIRQKTETELSQGDPFRGTVLRRLDRWEPIQVLWDRPQRSVDVIRPGQMALPGCDAQECDSLVEHPGSLVEHPVPPENCNNPNKQSKSTEQKNNPQQQGRAGCADNAVVALLSSYGVVISSCPELAQCDYVMARAWCLYTDTQILSRPEGFIVSRLRAKRAPPHEFVVLADIGEEEWAWLEKHAKARAYGTNWPPGCPVSEYAAELWYDLIYQAKERK